MTIKRPNNMFLRHLFVAYFLLSAFLVVGHIHQRDDLVKVSAQTSLGESAHVCPACAFRTTVLQGGVSAAPTIDIYLSSYAVELPILSTQTVGEVMHWLLPGTRAPPTLL